MARLSYVKSTLWALFLGRCGADPAPPGDASRDALDAPSDAPVEASQDAMAPEVEAPEAWRERYPVDGRFTEAEWHQLQALSPVYPLPRDDTNRVADDPRAAALGRLLFEDPGFSSSGRVSCATCHEPSRAFTDGRVVAEAVGRGARNTPSVFFAAYTRWPLWDGAADSLWAQPLMAVENPREHDSSRLALAHRMAERYRAPYEAVFAPLPRLEDGARFPPRGRPGDPPWEAMTRDDQRAVNRVAADFGKAIEAFERTLVAPPAAFDRYMAGEREALTERQRDGLAVFVRVGCVHCHSGPLFSDDEFHSVRAPDDPIGGPDRGRIDAIARVQASVFNTDGPFSDRPTGRTRTLVASPSLLGAFRTPTLRGVSRTAPYAHAGTLPTLEAMILHETSQGLPPGDPRSLGRIDPELLPRITFAPGELDALVAFLQAL
ncbi:MAG: cytochrome-c peroxidase [Deltaproteobacteria bacterium]|nr:cytochrome-c peroxidase [Deltaproteobacteria bacterium]